MSCFPIMSFIFQHKIKKKGSSNRTSCFISWNLKLWAVMLEVVLESALVSHIGDKGKVMEPGNYIVDQMKNIRYKTSFFNFRNVPKCYLSHGCHVLHLRSTLNTLLEFGRGGVRWEIVKERSQSCGQFSSSTFWGDIQYFTAIIFHHDKPMPRIDRVLLERSPVPFQPHPNKSPHLAHLIFPALFMWQTTGSHSLTLSFWFAEVVESVCFSL